MEFNPTLLERVNPVYNTAKMTVFQLASMGDEDAIKVSQKLGLTMEETQNSEHTQTTEEQQKIGVVMLEARYKTAEIIAEKTGYKTLVDLPCGYTPRAARVAKKGVSYYGLDLPATIADIEWVMHEVTVSEYRNFVRYKSVDATNYESLERALEKVEGEICITTEGLLMYFTDSEVDSMCENIRKLLKKHGGCWILTDPEVTIQYVLTAQAVYGDRFQSIMQNAKQQVDDKSDIDVGKAKILVKPGPDAAEGIKQAMGILASHGLKAERLTVADYMPELATLEGLQEIADNYKEAMTKCAYWKVTLADADAQGQADGDKADFDVKAQMSGGTLAMTLIGRVDTLTSPEVLSLFEELSAKETIQGVKIDCTSLEYISSAGLRVLLIMHKKCPDGVVLTSVNSLVSDILDQTGFADIFEVE
ncbi:MAG: STAS domain-containing protein [Eubacterium sp.]|nr:STAS domain-containing protein [Eubacterium sp.]